MKVHGWCIRCHRIKRVRTNLLPRGGTPIGVCDDCEAKR